MIMSTTAILTVAMVRKATATSESRYCKGRVTWGDDTLLLMVDAKASPQTLNNGVLANLNDEVGGTGMCLENKRTLHFP